MESLKTKLKQTNSDFKLYSINDIPLFKGEKVYKYIDLIKKKTHRGTLYHMIPSEFYTDNKVMQTVLGIRKTVTFTIFPPWTAIGGALILQTGKGTLVIPSLVWIDKVKSRGVCVDKNSYAILIPKNQKSIEKELMNIITGCYGVNYFVHTYSGIKTSWT